MPEIIDGKIMVEPPIEAIEKGIANGCRVLLVNLWKSLFQSSWLRRQLICCGDSMARWMSFWWRIVCTFSVLLMNILGMKF